MTFETLDGDADRCVGVSGFNGAELFAFGHVFDLTRTLRRGSPAGAEHDESAFVSFGITRYFRHAAD
jgi:hypothetical protein